MSRKHHRFIGENVEYACPPTQPKAVPPPTSENTPMNSSPTLDLDMNLGSPPWNDRTANADGVLIAVGNHAHAVQPAQNESADSNQTTNVPADEADHSLSSQTATEVQPATTETNDEIFTTEEATRPGGSLVEMMELVESWREDAYMMSVKNAILLDDLVKVGADI